MNSKHQISSVVGICTKDRPSELCRCIDAVIAANHTNRPIYVVDSSESLESRYVCEDFETRGFNVRYFHSAPGLTIQRNHLIRNLPNEAKILHFLDDDSVVLEGYFDAIEAVFIQEPAAVGVGGAIKNLPVHTFRLLDRLFGLASKRQGVVLRSGVNILNFTGSQREVDWLSGCSMSFRTTIFSKCLFDESRSGNGVGEDVDFCLRSKKLGKIIWTPDAIQEHLQSPINRLSQKANQRKVLAHRLRLAEDGLGRVSKLRVFLTFAFEVSKSNIKPWMKKVLRKSV